MSKRPDWLRSLGRAAYHAAPASFWRSVDGFRNDLANLPARLRDPERRNDPWETIHHVGGDYRNTGRESVAFLRAHGGLTAEDRVLDIGCGNGRVTWPLTEALGPEGGYVGFDVSPAAIRYCRRRIGPVRPDFQFHHLDIRNGIYNPKGRSKRSRPDFPARMARSPWPSPPPSSPTCPGRPSSATWRRPAGFWRPAAAP